MPDCEDPEVMLAEPVWRWQQTDHGRWVMENAHDLTYHQQIDAQHWGYDVVIRGVLSDPRKITEYFLRWPAQS
jgi:hypothetical protein